MAIDFDRVQKPARKLRKLLKKMPARPAPEDVHDFRTHSRQLEANLEAFALDTARTGRRILKPLSRLRKRAGKVRDMDVLTGYVSRMPQQDDEQDCSVELLEYLGAQRRKYADKFDAVSRQDGAKLRKVLKKGKRKFAKLESRLDKDSAGGNSIAIDPTASAIEIAAELSAPARLNRANLHAFRLKVKELRNVLKLADSPDQRLIDVLGDVKDAIGEWHDWEELIAIAEKALDHGAQCGLIRELKQNARKRYETALAQAEQLRNRYLKISEKKRARSKRPHPGEPVWDAAMKLAA
ncbi:MAG TPA: CHAD domain-containing protein [Candidatus Sulfotelmatobacter sp.]|nr:CHAD domain-containing protein [Candidatus Sulfotelmatobacter sp.]